MKKLLYIFILLTCSANAQVVLERQVIGSTGGYVVGTNMSLSSTVGEAVVQTLFSVSKILTQGFQQPNSFNNNIVTYEIINESCRGAANGSVYISNVLGCPGPYSITVVSVFDTATALDETKLKAGQYIVKIVGATSCTYNQLVTVGIDSDEGCKLKFYSGLTPNGDGDNDTWYVDNIEQFPINDVKIFNRWGDLVWEKSNYSNEKEKIWDGTNQSGKDLPDGTYFYIADVAGTIYKGWVELTR
ncbi:MAG: gliding motility-associated C-terminal domain-containing protein [Flavobacteriales bacterium]|nr:gliding motility-associated C-terminal domain-containing protein [Flavobacteriales bacterium]